MPLVNWSDATPADLAGFTMDYLREELARRNLDATGSKEEIISHLIADIAQNRPTTPPLLSPDSAASTQRCNAAPLPPSFDAAQTTELLTGLLQQLLHVSQRAAAPVQVTTLPDLSASLPTYSGDGRISASHWVEELERTRNLASWEPSTLLAVALGKLRGAAADWKAVIGRQCPTWETFRQAFLDQFSAKQTLLQWQQAVTCRVQAHGENLVSYSLAKFKLISGCPVTLTDPQRIEYALQGIADVNLATTIAAQRPETVAAYMDIVTQLDQTLSHSSLRAPRTGYPSAKLPTPSPQAPPRSTVYMNPQAVSAGLQQSPLPGPDEPPWLALSCHNYVSSTYSLSSTSNRAAISMIEVHIDPSLPAVQLGSHLPVPQQQELTSILSKHTEVFARGEDDLGLYEGVEHAIDLLPDAVPYSRSPYPYSAADRRFLEAQTSTLLRQGIILRPSGSTLGIPRSSC
ncbi:hypothetical protein HPB49_002342 [Dermacentor silvarum]|uniref:Uncharacterized protein n=1 Tax=Dermacentor silvarum TaxID=543639 RepID=A0ACB8DTC8_DERSI|nr:hypothetical protein HPB49_002342 [Dermacentor silvarum]